MIKRLWIVFMWAIFFVLLGSFLLPFVALVVYIINGEDIAQKYFDWILSMGKKQ